MSSLNRLLVTAINCDGRATVNELKDRTFLSLRPHLNVIAAGVLAVESNFQCERLVFFLKERRQEQRLDSF